MSKSKTLPVSKRIYALFKVITWCLHFLSDISSRVAVPQMACSRNSFRAYICASSVDKHFSFYEFLSSTLLTKYNCWSRVSKWWIDTDPQTLFFPVGSITLHLASAKRKCLLKVLTQSSKVYLTTSYFN